MKRTITQFRTSLKLLGKSSMLAMLGLITYSSFGQYTQPIHYAGACYYTTSGYAAIEQVKITDQSGNVVYNKAADGANNCYNGYQQGHYNVIEPTSAFTLSAGASYTISVSTSNVTNSTLAAALGIWIDFNGDEDFADAGEFITKANIQQASGAQTPGALKDYNFTVPCGGSTGTIRMRIRTDYYYYGFNASSHSTSATGGSIPYYGETEDFACTYKVPSGLSSNFFSPTTAFVGTVVNFTNSNQTGYIAHDWTITDASSKSTSYSTTNAQNVFASTGTYTVKLVSENCLGKDSTTKTITIVNPTAPPVSNFIADNNVVEIFETVNFTDLSTNGATFWDWIFVQGTDTIDGDDQFALRGGNPYVNRNPEVFTGNYTGALSIGTWQVCLKASNAIPGSSYTCKMGYITVQQSSYNMGAQTQLPAGIITTSSGVLFDKGGISGNYPSGGATPETQEALIAPCGAQSVSLDFTTFQVAANATLRIYDGTNALGTPLHTGKGFTNTDDTSTIGTITANSGAMYLLWVATSGKNDVGFAANWSSVAGTGATPTAAITMPGTTLYNAVPVNFLNASINAEGNTSREWTITGPTGSPTTTIFTTKDIENYTFLANGDYTISLTVTTCDNQSSTTTQSFTVAAPNSPTELDFTADNRRPNTGEEVTFTATSDKANQWEWSVFPNTGWIKAPGNTTNPSQAYTFSAPGSYTVQCVAYNAIDQAASETTVVKTAYIIVVQHCTPIIGVTTSSDVGISYVGITDPISGEVLMDNNTTSGTAYTDYSSLGTIDVNFGGTYDFEIKRPTTVNPMSRRIWIDWNVDGDFDDVGEANIMEATANTASWTGSFTVPDASTAFEATTRMRIGVSYDTDPNEACGAGTNPAANRIGEFEDYAIRVVNDGDLPVITLNGDSVVYIEQVANAADANYVSDSAVVMDPSQGDITENVDITSDLDQTLPGVYFEVYNAKDASGNEAVEVTRLIYVVSDQTAPQITVNGSTDVTIEVGTTWNDLGASALDNKEGVLTDAIVTTGIVNENVLGDYTITYSVKDNQGNASSATRIVRVVDTQLPVIENASADKSGACWTVEVQLQNIFADITNATDNYNSLGNGLTFTASPAAPQGGAAVDTRFQGTTTVTYTATDESGNVTTQCVDYVVRDYIAPVINLRTLDVINHRVNTPYTPVPATASDNLYNNTQISLTGSSNVDAYTLGTYQDTYTAIDAAGNTSTAIRTVNVIDDLKPTITGKRGPIVKLGVGSQVDAIDYVLFADNYDVPTDLAANHTVVSNDLNLQEAGIYSVVFKTEDNSGNESDNYVLLFEVGYQFEKEINSVNTVSLDDLLAVSPNPTSGQLNISVNLSENEVINLAIFNTVGQEVLTVTNGKVSNGNYTVDLNDQANGIYYVKMNVKGTIVTKKIVLNN